MGTACCFRSYSYRALLDVPQIGNMEAVADVHPRHRATAVSAQQVQVGHQDPARHGHRANWLGTLPDVTVLYS